MEHSSRPEIDVADDRRAALSQLLAREGLDEGASGAPAITPRGGGPAPLSFAQEVLWLLDRAMPGQTAYNSAVVRRVRGPVDVAALRWSLETLVARHEVLRTVVETRGEEPVQIARGPERFALIEHDLGSVAEGEREARAIRILQEAVDTPFQLAADPPFRAVLVRLAVDEAMLLLLTHHIASDGWSYGILLRELNALYGAAVNGDDAGLPPVKLQFSDYASWQREHLRGEELDRRLAYWRERLAGVPVLDLPSRTPRVRAQGFAGACRTLVLPGVLVDSIHNLARARGATLYMVLLAAYQIVLHRCSGQDDIVVGSAVVGRTRRETENMVGYFSQALPMRTCLAGDPTFAEVLERVSETVLGAFDHQDVPLEALVLDVQRQRPTHDPLFRVVLTMQDTLTTDLRLAGTEVSPVAVDGAATKFDLTLLATERAGELELALWYRTELFDSDTVDRLLRQVGDVLESAVSEPFRRISELPILTAEEQGELLSWSRGPAVNAPGGVAEVLVPAAIASRAKSDPDVVAVTDGATTLTYGDLADRSARLAERLRVVGVQRNTPVGVALERSADAVVSMLGVWQAGGYYVPLVPDLPPQRVAQQASATGLRVAITRAELVDLLPPGVVPVLVREDDERSNADGVATVHEGAADAMAPARASDLAYVLFTSGSTGTPKAVAVTHGNLASYVAGITARLGLEAADPMHFATVTTLAADLGHTALFPALTTGGMLHVLSEETASEPALFARAMAEGPVDVLKITPGHLQALIAAWPSTDVKALLPAKWLISGGDTLSWSLADLLVGAGVCRVLNHYGPTETTVGVTSFEITPTSAAEAKAAGARTVPIGRPLPGARVSVLDGYDLPVPQGVPGELFAGGGGVASGYLNDPERTLERFVPDPFVGSGARMYRTGDRVRWLSGGVLEFLGRVDDQLKVRGFRVEPGEIAAVLQRHPAVTQAVVIATVGAPGADPMLVAYVVPAATGYAAAHGERATPESLSRFVARHLPDYMVPSAFVVLDALPLTANGKLDRDALPDPDRAEGGSEAMVAPRTQTEETIARIWADVLKVEHVGMTDQFLRLGGHSLLAIRILGRLSKEFGVRLPLRSLFDAPTVAQLARVVDQARADASPGASAGA